MLRILLPVLLLTLSACKEKEFTSDPAESFKIAKDPYDQEDWEKAIQKLGEFKSRFPYSQYSVESELLIANSQFNLKKFEESATSYAQFVKLHPKHAEVAFAMFRVGESYWQLSAPEIDRDQEYTHRAVEEWQKLVDRLPESKFAKEAKNLVEKGKRRIAESFDFAARFYCKQEIYHACAFRYIDLAKKYPEFKDLRKVALNEAARALDIVAVQKKEDPKSDKNVYFNTMSYDQIIELAKSLRNDASHE